MAVGLQTEITVSGAISAGLSWSFGNRVHTRQRVVRLRPSTSAGQYPAGAVPPDSGPSGRRCAGEHRGIHEADAEPS